MQIPRQVRYRIKLCEQGMIVLGTAGESVLPWNELYGLCRRLGIAEEKVRKWRSTYGCLGPDQARRLRELEREDERLPRLLPPVSGG